ncbi:unnamed protein product [Schistosoma bovis]|nr:unnamed protein product [Schistosoma bovis]
MILLFNIFPLSINLKKQNNCAFLFLLFRICSTLEFYDIYTDLAPMSDSTYNIHDPNPYLIISEFQY